MYSWNSCFNKVIEIKREFEKKIQDVDIYLIDSLRIEGIDILTFMIESLNYEEYLKWLTTIKISYFKNFIEIHYNLIEAAEEMWSNKDSINLEARGIVIDIIEEKIVNCPFRKFFNIGETKETELELIKKMIQKAKVLEISDKLDGSMQSASFYNGGIFLSGSESCNPIVSWRVRLGTEYINNRNNYSNMIKENPNLTFIFELIHPFDGHIVSYTEEKEGLYLIGIRENLTGIEYSYKKIKEYVDKYNVLFTNIENITFEELFLEKEKYSANEKEGWVINIDGFKVKFKCDDYLQMHKCYSQKSLAKLLLRAVADNEIDDVISNMPESYREKSNKILSQIYNYINNYKKELFRIYENCPKDNIKEFSIYVGKLPKELRDYKANLFNIYKGNDLWILKSINGKYKSPLEIGIEDNLKVKLLSSKYEEEEV